MFLATKQSPCILFTPFRNNDGFLQHKYFFVRLLRTLEIQFSSYQTPHLNDSVIIRYIRWYSFKSFLILLKAEFVLVYFSLLQYYQQMGFSKYKGVYKINTKFMQQWPVTIFRTEPI
jgi:hypothetical protein